MTKFVHLSVASEYSVNYSICRIPEIIDAAVADNMPAIAITDYGNLYAAFKFYSKAVKAGVKPIIAAKVRFLVAEVEFEVLLYCQTYQGFKILNRLIFAAQDQGLCISKLAEFNIEGIILVLPPCIALAQKSVDLGLLFAAFPDSAYVGIDQIAAQEIINYQWQTAVKYDLPVVVVHPVCFIKPEDFEAHEVRVCINRGELFKEDKKYFANEQWFKSQSDMLDLFKDQTIALENSVEIAKRCNFIFEQGVNHLPLFPVPDGISLDEFFSLESHKGLQQRYAVHLPADVDKDVYSKRLAIEINIIQKMQFPGYFLIVADFIKWSRENGIPVGPGRGSGAGSLVAYALGITDIDPIHYGLLFERFLNPERVSMPDFDIDFCMDGRDKVIDYVSDKYGADHVSQIITFGTLAAKAVVRDVGRVLGHPYGFMDKIAKLIPMDLGMTLGKALAAEPELQDRCRKEPEVERIFSLAQKLEGLVRQVGRHAGGVVIAPRPLLDFMPVDYDVDQGSVSQFDKDDLESIGLVKFDFLGLRTLTIIDWTLKSIEASKLDAVELHSIPLDDEIVFSLLQAGNSTAVFQLESRGMKELIKRLKPDCFEDIVSLVALFRPGPLQSGMVDDFIDRKHGLAEITYPHPSIEPILASTYGVILYQEQVMQIAQVLSGYTLGGADLLRRAMGKKKPEEMAKQRDIFVSGAIKNAVDGKLAGDIFDLIEKFAGYGFNRSHSVAYAMLSYQTAWFKAHYPSHFMAAVLTSDMDNTDKIIGLLADCRRLGITVRPPNVEEGEFGFTVNSAGEIVYGLGGIKGAGQAAILTIIAYRNQHKKVGGLDSLVDCLVRQGKMNKKLIEALCFAGALDVWQIARERIIASIESAQKHASQQLSKQASGQGDLFGSNVVMFDYLEADSWDIAQKLENEKQVLGYYASGHPVDAMLPELKKLGFRANSNASVGRNRKFVGMISEMRAMQSKHGKPMLFFLLSDGSAALDVAVFGKEVALAKEVLQNNKFIVVTGDVSLDERNNRLRVQASEVISLDDLKFARAKVLYLKIKDAAPRDFIEILQDNFAKFPRGEVRVILSYMGETILAGPDYHIGLQSYFVELLTELDWLELSFGYEIPESCRSYK